jgi:hypothetical protein
MRAESSLIDVGCDSSAFVQNPGDRGREIEFDLQRGNPPTLSRLRRGSPHFFRTAVLLLCHQISHPFSSLGHLASFFVRSIKLPFAENSNNVLL